jgi:hypothetical protein
MFPEPPIRTSVDLDKIHWDDDSDDVDEEAMMALLLINEQVFLNHRHMKVHASKEPSWNIVVYVICNDIFAWASADAESVGLHELKDLYLHFRRDPIWGTAIWCCKKRKMMPQAPCS